MQTTQTLTPLARRLKRLDQKLPSDDRYGQYLSQSLLQLLVTPVNVLFGQDHQGLKEYRSKWAVATRLLQGDRASPGAKEGTFETTYQGQLELIYRLMEKANWDWSLVNRDRRVTTAADLLSDLAQQLSALQTPCARQSAPSGRPQPKSLQARLDSARKYPADKTLEELVGGMPPHYREQVLLDHSRKGEFPVLTFSLTHYFYAASLLRESNIPLQAGKDYFQSSMKRNFSLLFMLLLQLDELPAMADGDGIDIAGLYHLLVDPIFPREIIERTDET